MALIGKIREKSGLTVIIVGVGVILFLVGRELFSLIPAGAKTNPIVGKVAGKHITLNKFQNQFDQLQNNFWAQYNRTPADYETSFLREQAWQQLVENIIYEQMYNKLGIQVSEDELVDMVQGEHIHPDIKAAFTNPETKEFDKKQLLNYLQKLAQMSPAHQAYWHEVEKGFAANRCQQKFDQLMRQSAFVTNLEVQKKYGWSHTTLDMKYIFVPYEQIPGDQYTITDAMLKDYLKANQHAYQVEERKDIAYVRFPIQPTAEDNQALQEELKTIKHSFMQTQEDVAFARIHTDEGTESVQETFAGNELPKALLQQKDQLKKGMVLGPIVAGNWHKIYKVIATKEGKDKKEKQYELAIIAKMLSPGDEAREQAFRKANDWVSVVKNRNQFEKHAEQENLVIHQAQLNKNDRQIHGMSQARELVRWIYNEGSMDQVSPVFELADEYVVAVTTAHIKPGLASLENVRAELTNQLINEKKAQAVQSQWVVQADQPLENIAAAYGHGAQVFTAKQVKWNQSTLPSVGKAAKVIGQAFVLKPGERSQPIAANQGLCVVEVIERHEENIPSDLSNYQKELTQLEQFKQSYYIPKSLENLANTKDFRYKYY